jgi:N-formylglutamate amidohydrolase
MVLSDSALTRELLLLTDWYTDELFALPNADAVAVRHPVSRLVLDPERFLDDTQESMAARGMGVVYTRTSDGEVLRNPPTASEREALIGRYYKPHHARLSEAVRDAMDVHGYSLVIDCHSFPNRPLPCHDYRESDSPDICIGTDSFHTPSWLRDMAKDAYESAGWTVAVDHPFRGALVPLEHFGLTPKVHAIMVELNRRLYMDEQTGAKLPTFSAVANANREILLRLIREVQARLTDTHLPVQG